MGAPTTGACCGGSRLAKIGEDVTKTREEFPRRLKLIETVREKFSCRDCEKISQPPAPFHATPRGFIGPQLLATILFDKFGTHIPLNRQSARFNDGHCVVQHPNSSCCAANSNRTPHD